MSVTFEFSLKGDEILLAASRQFRRQIPKVMTNAIRRVLRRRITVIKKRIRAETGIGDTVWGKREVGLNKLVTLIRARGTEDTITTGIKLKGLPAMIETGGQTVAHLIRPKNAERLAFMLNGRLILAKKVNHPGSRIRPHGIARQVLEGAGPDIRREINDAIAKLKTKLFAGLAA